MIIETIKPTIKNIIGYLTTLIGYQTPTELGVQGVNILWDISKHYNASVVLTGNKSLIINNLTKGDYGTLEVTQGGSGSYTLALPTIPVSKVVNGGNGVVKLSTTVGAKDTLTFYYNGSVLLWNIGKNYT